jgi:hypothetical protein
MLLPSLIFPFFFFLIAFPLSSSSSFNLHLFLLNLSPLVCPAWINHLDHRRITPSYLATDIAHAIAIVDLQFLCAQ